MQSDNPRAVGYIPPDVWQPPDDSTKPLTSQEEASLLLGEVDVDDLPPPEDTPTILQTRQRFRVCANVYLDIRKEPDIDAERVPGETLKIGDEIDVTETMPPKEGGIVFLKLADGRGWVFDSAEVHGARMQLLEPLDVEMSPRKARRKAAKKVCMRCWHLANYNECDEIFRPDFGVAAVDEVGANEFEQMLSDTLQPIEEATVFAVVDVFDFGPSTHLLRYLAKQLQQKKKVAVKIVANKIDLLPTDVNELRVRTWAAGEAKKAGLSVGPSDVYIVSTLRGDGIKTVHRVLDRLDAPRQFVVVGAANAGKSSFMNRLACRKRRAPGHKVSVAQATGFTVSDLPGTTLRPTAVRYLKGNSTITDTPGLLAPGSLCRLLTMAELHDVIPQKAEFIRVTYAMKTGRSIMLGGLARIEILEGGRDCNFTFVVSERVKLHVTSNHRFRTSLEKHGGQRLTPPHSYERCMELQPFVDHIVKADGIGWNEACGDIVIHGLGWIAVTANGPVVARVWTPKGVEVSWRDEPLLPYEARWTGVRPHTAPGWFQYKGRVTRGFEIGKERLKLRGKF